MKYYVFDLMINHIKLELEREYSLSELKLLIVSLKKEQASIISDMSFVCLGKVIKDMKEKQIEIIKFTKKTILLRLAKETKYYPFFGYVKNPILLVEDYDLMDIECNLFNKIRWKNDFTIVDYEDFENYLKE